MSDPAPEPFIEHAIDRDQKLVRTKLVGPVTVDQIEAYMRRVDADPEYDLTFDAIIDIRLFTGSLDHEGLRRLALTIRSYPGRAGARRAVLVADDLQFGLMRMLEAFTSLAPVIYRAFRVEATAMAWLAERHRPSGPET